MLESQHSCLTLGRPPFPPQRRQELYTKLPQPTPSQLLLSAQKSQTHPKSGSKATESPRIAYRGHEQGSRRWSGPQPDADLAASQVLAREGPSSPS